MNVQRLFSTIPRRLSKIRTTIVVAILFIIITTFVMVIHPPKNGYLRVRQARENPTFHNYQPHRRQSSDTKVHDSTRYAVYSANTPDGESHRNYDYAFYLPLTALAWERVGFKSVVVLIGSRCEWSNNPTLRLILDKLEVDRKATVLFLEAPLENRMLLSQVARIFVTNLPGFPGQDYDYVFTGDADQWPLRREHYITKPDHKVYLYHTQCCEPFTVPWRANKSFPMYPLSPSGAYVSTWREIMNEGHFVAHNAELVLQYFEAEGFGPIVRQKGKFNGQGWFLDQKMVSIRLAEWMEKHGNGSPPVYRVSDEGLKQIARYNWEGDLINATELEKRYDAQMLFKPFLLPQWEWIQPLLGLMYGGNQSEQYKWCQDYFDEFQKHVKYYLHWGTINYDKQENPPIRPRFE